MASGKPDPKAETVILNTGEGLKTLDAVINHVGPTATIQPKVSDVREALCMSAEVTVRVPTILRTYTGGEAEVTVDPSGTSGGETWPRVLEALEANHPESRHASWMIQVHYVDSSTSMWATKTFASLRDWPRQRLLELRFRSSPQSPAASPNHKGLPRFAAASTCSFETCTHARGEVSDDSARTLVATVASAAPAVGLALAGAAGPRSLPTTCPHRRLPPQRLMPRVV